MTSVVIDLKRIDMDNRKVILDVLGNFCQKGKDDLGRDMMYIKMENAGDLADSLVLNLSQHIVSKCPDCGNDKYPKWNLCSDCITKKEEE